MGRDVSGDALVQLRQQRPMGALPVVVGGMVSQVARQQVEVPIVDIVACFEMVVGVETGVVIIGNPRRK